MFNKTVNKNCTSNFKRAIFKFITYPVLKKCFNIFTYSDQISFKKKSILILLFATQCKIVSQKYERYT